MGSGNPGGSLARLRELAQLTLGYIGESLVRLWELTQTTPVYKQITRVHIINAIVIHVTSFFFIVRTIMNLKSDKDDQRYVLKKLKEFATFFQQHFLNKTVHFTYNKGNHNVAVKVVFMPIHFQHLVGIRYGLGAKRFWNHVLKGNVNWQEVTLTNFAKQRANKFGRDKRSSFEKKLNSLSAAKDIMTERVRVCEEGKMFGVEYNHLIRTNRQTIGLACKNDKFGEYFISNLDLTDLRDKDKQGHRVVQLTSFNRKKISISDLL